jgi:hypothetical protein
MTRLNNRSLTDKQSRFSYPIGISYHLPFYIFHSRLLRHQLQYFRYHHHNLDRSYDIVMLNRGLEFTLP